MAHPALRRNTFLKLLCERHGCIKRRMQPDWIALWNYLQISVCPAVISFMTGWKAGGNNIDWVEITTKLLRSKKRQFNYFSRIVMEEAPKQRHDVSLLKSSRWGMKLHRGWNKTVAHTWLSRDMSASIKALDFFSPCLSWIVIHHQSSIMFPQKPVFYLPRK